MSLAAELLLSILIIALYLNDSLTLLHTNEAVMEQGLAGGWKARFGTRRFTLLGKHVFFGGLLPPHTAIFRLAWSMEKDAPEAPGWEEHTQRLRPLQWGAAFLFLFAIVLMPLALIVRAGDTVLLGLIGAAYAGTLTLAAMLWRRRKHLGLTNGSCLKLGAELLLCPPIAVNLPRRLSLQHQVGEDFVSACRRMLVPDDWSLAAAQVACRIEDAMEEEGEGSQRHAALSRRKRSLA